MRTALVTGASRGIGRAVAERLAAKGYGLTIAARGAEALVELAAHLRATGSPHVEHRATNVGQREDLGPLVRQHADTFGSMDVLVLNAGTGTAGAADAVDLRAYDRMIEVNLTSAFVLTREAMPLLRAAAAAEPERGARVIGLSSITGVYPEAGLAVYGATKAALMSFVETLNVEVSGDGVLATAIAPGYVDTDMSAWATDRIPAETMIPVADVVAVVDMLTELSRRTVVPHIVMTRSGTSGFEP